MGLLSRTWEWLTEPLETRSLESFEFTPLGEAVKQFHGLTSAAWQPASIKDALGVPAIQRAVSLIANTTGSLTVEGLRGGMPMIEPPRIIQRPDPFQTPREFYRDTAYYLATRGEAVWWIAARDFDQLPASLIIVPAHELNIEKNERDRRFPVYRWGKTVSTRYSPIANQTGEFVHLTYLKEPGELRGKGPLQMCGAAISVTVEAQQWAANFFAGDISAVELQSLVDVTKEEAEALRDQWMERGETGTPRVTPPTLNWKDHTVDPESAQMVEARTHQDGEAARMFGIPGKLLEYAAPSSSLTYQNIAEVFTDFVRSCLSINYLEPIEQAMSDLLPRTTAARFNVEGLLRADIKTRFEVYEKAIAVFGAEQGAEYARQREGLAPGDIERQPVPFSPPTAVPASLPETRSAELELQIRQAEQIERVDRLTVAMEVLPDSLKSIMEANRPEPPTVINNHYPSTMIQAPPPAQVNVTNEVAAPPPAEVNIRNDVAAPDMTGVAEALTALADRPQPDITVNTPEVHVAPPSVTFEEGAITSPDITVKPATVTVNVPEQAPPVVNVNLPASGKKRVVRDKQDRIIGLE